MPIRRFVKSRTRVRRTRSAAQKAARGDRVTKARLRTIRKVAKTVVMKNHELKSTLFSAVNAATVTVPIGTNCAVQPYSVAAAYPAQGDSKRDRDGIDYMLLKVQFAFQIKALGNNPGVPLHVYLLQVPRGTTVTQSSSTALTSFWTDSASVSLVRGHLDPKYGRVVKKMTFYPPRRVVPENTYYHMTTPSNSYVEASWMQKMITLNMKKRIRCSSASAEVPVEVGTYTLLFHQPTPDATLWHVQSQWLACVFKDI